MREIIAEETKLHISKFADDTKSGGAVSREGFKGIWTSHVSTDRL